jgi:hypothetical protein
MGRRDENRGINVSFVDMCFKIVPIKYPEDNYGKNILNENRHIGSYLRDID